MTTETTFPPSLHRAAAAFGFTRNLVIQPVGNGLINSTFRVEGAGRAPILLQQLNTTIFRQPRDVQHNYEVLSQFLTARNYYIPALQKTTDKDLLWQNNSNDVWRAFEFIPDSYSPDLVSSKEEAQTVARCFGRFAAMLKDFPAAELKVILPRFHDLEWRYQQFEEALKETKLYLTEELYQIINALKQRVSLVPLFLRLQDTANYPLRVMHHDCKISNILFHQQTKTVICPVDLDTVQPGKFFSDLGDMIRTMCCTEDENSTEWNEISIQEEYYHEVISAYGSETGAFFTPAEKEHLHLAGLLLIYMQALRFLTDHLNGNVYYKVQYEAQNLDRAKNQLLLLQSLERLLHKKRLLPGY